MRISWKILAFGMALGAVVAQLLWFDRATILSRILTSLPFLAVIPGVYSGKKWCGMVAVVETGLMLVLLICTIAPEYDVPEDERVNASTFYLVSRAVLITGYSLIMLKGLALKLMPQFASSFYKKDSSVDRNE